MTSSLFEPDYFRREKALRSLVATLEFAGDILEGMLGEITGKEETRLKITDALIACARLRLENSRDLRPPNDNDQSPQSMSA